jgi:ATP-binding cassette subfamily B protein
MSHTPSNSASPTTERYLPTMVLNWALIRHAPWPYLLWSLCTIGFIVAPMLLGLIEKAIFDTISNATPATLGLWSLVALYVAVGLVRLLISFGSTWGDVTFRYTTGALVRSNLLSGLLGRPGALPLPVAPGEAVGRYRDDVNEITDFPLWFPYVIGYVLAFVIGVGIMAQINLRITLVIFLPLAVIVIVTRLAWGYLLRAMHDSRQADDAVVGFLGEAMGAVLAIKVASAEDSMITQFETLNEQRSRQALRVHLLRNLLNSINDSAVTFGIGITLLLAGQAMSAGTFTVGDFALFVSYLWFTTELPSIIGTFIGDYRQQQVAIGRLLELIPEQPAEALAHGPAPRQPQAPAPADEQPILLNVRGLSYRHPNSQAGIQGIDLSVPRGSFTVITGRIGAGKTTLLRVLLGLLPADSGEIRWNGAPIRSAANFFHPPQSAYVPQVPRLFSDSLRENILMGHPASEAELEQAIQRAVFETDLATLDQGLDTLVGPRGVRLSGGQVQRTAAARMLVRQPALVVVDDLSSALDIDTERQLWERLAQQTDQTGARPTFLVVSHRQAALQRADQIIVLKDGGIEAVGTFAELAERSEEFQAIWQNDSPASN